MEKNKTKIENEEKDLAKENEELKKKIKELEENESLKKRLDELNTPSTPSSKEKKDYTRELLIGLIVVVLLALIIILLILGSKNNSNNNGTNSNSNTPSYSSNQSDMMTQFYKYWKSDKPTLIVFASATCGVCTLQKPILNAVQEQFNLDYLYLDYTQLTGTNGTEDSTVVQLLGIEGATPTFVVVQNETVILSQEGFMDADELVQFLVDQELLPEGSKFKSSQYLTAIDYKKLKELMNSKNTTAIYFDQPTCGGTCLTEQLALADIAKDQGVTIYHLKADTLSAEDGKELISKLGEWGYSTDAYKTNQSVRIPLLMFVRDGKIIWHQGEETYDAKQLLQLFKDQKLVD